MICFSTFTGFAVEVFIILAKILLDFHGVQSDQYHTQKEKEVHIMILNTHPENRKEMVKAICELTGMNATYLFTPTYAYQVGPITVSRDGTIDCEDEAMQAMWLCAGTHTGQKEEAVLLGRLPPALVA